MSTDEPNQPKPPFSGPPSEWSREHQLGYEAGIMFMKEWGDGILKERDAIKLELDAARGELVRMTENRNKLKVFIENTTREKNGLKAQLKQVTMDRDRLQAIIDELQHVRIKE